MDDKAEAPAKPTGPSSNQELRNALAAAEADRDAYKDALEAIMGQHDHYVVGRPCYQRFDNPSMWCPACIGRVALARGL